MSRRSISVFFETAKGEMASGSAVGCQSSPAT